MESFNYRQILREKIIEKLRKQPQLSLRSIALSSGISQPFLTRVLNGQKHLSKSSASKLFPQLGFSQQEESYFLDLIEYEKTQDPNLKRLLLEKMKLQYGTKAEVTLELDQFKIIEDWYHYAILEHSELTDSEPTPRALGKKFGISSTEASDSVERLLRIGLLKREKGRLRKTKKIFQTPSGVPSESLKKHHAQMISRASDALREQSVSERVISSITLPASTEVIAEIEPLIRKFQNDLSRVVAQHPAKKDSVYQFNLQFFRLNKKEKKK